MKIAILSDIHDNIWNLEKALMQIKQSKCETVIFCGDLCAPFTGKILADSNLETFAIWGNNDEDHWAIVRRLGKNFHAFALTDEFGTVELDGKKIAFCHYPRLAELLAKTGDYDAVFHGHTHKTYSKFGKSTLLANPGAVCGIVNGKPGLASFMVWDTLSNKIQLNKIDEKK